MLKIKDLACVTLAAAMLLGPASAPALAAPSPAPYAGYLLVHFTGEGADGEQIYFATSKDGLHWQDLNNSKPVLRSDIGEKGLRDPAILRAADGKKFYILATDLRIASGKGWDAAMHRGSTSLIIFESSDLVHWSPPRKVDIARDIPDAGCAWAPEAIFDETTGEYIVYWATISTLDGINKPRIYYAKTRDFVTFTPARIYIDRPGKTGLIDTQVVKMDDDSSGYRYYRASGDGQITLEGGKQILGDWKTIGDLRSVGLTGKDVEGPILFKFNGSEQWSLWVDQFATGKGYLALASSNLSDAANFRRLGAAEVDFGASKKRHGSVLNITAAEYQAIVTKCCGKK